jgi:para-nitrobenzyl esterase
MGMVPGDSSEKVRRREFVQCAALYAGLGIFGRAFADAATATVTTVEGELQGSKSNGGYQFRGVRYAGPQTVANRFRPPLPLMPWKGTRVADRDGNAALQIFSKRPDFGGPFVTGLSDETPQGEDCLFLNIFTPSLKGSRPVMFWCHGGGFASGGGGLPLYDGTNLATYGDVVVVSINHRLNIFGFGLPNDSGPFSANVGMLDIVEALKWVRRNIANFGGDPDSVTIFGQSGGGAKVSTLLVMPSAKGLFKRAIVESGSTIRLRAEAEILDATAKVATELGVSPDKLATMPAQQLLEGIRAVSNGFSPIVDGHSVSRHPFDPDAPPDSRDIPMIIGTVRTEASYTTDNSLFMLDEPGMEKHVHDVLGDAAAPLIATYKGAYPNATPSLIYFLIASDCGARRNAITQSERKSAQGGAPVYMYHFEWPTPVNNIWYSPHAIEIPFVFRNLALTKPSIGSGPEQDRLANQVSSAWVSFAHTGIPSNEVTGDWAPYEPQKRLTMIFDRQTSMVADPDHDARVAIFRALGTGPLKRGVIG